ncbi:GNAT family N-acetyltransferase [Acinetobacter sp. WCHAc060033]|uniref:GNAT family N-acetyltransferase n=2 Tax=Moraxellaceae TaxID=468 RepID=A0A3G2T8V4_9GAMM|nr:GNAT family N-acetyltransferase [Acinetobacter wuhouensis]RZG87044.1 GNAT family N-acetyltransferase [Acinetobacter sp. WCHAc060033]
MLTFRQVIQTNETDILTIQSIYEGSPHYFQMVQGQTDTVRHDLQALPNGCSSEQKFFYAIYSNKIAIGCMDLIRGYPNQQTIFIGLLLFKESHQCLGFGVKALGFIIELAQQWECHRIRIAVLESNQRALSFWLREGFVELYRRNKNDNHLPVIVMEKVLNT